VTARDVPATHCTGYDTADEAARAGWDDVPGATGIYRSSRWLRSLDAHDTGARRRYWIARRGGAAVGAACMFVPRAGDNPSIDARALVIGDLAAETSEFEGSTDAPTDAARYGASIAALDRALPATPEWGVVALPFAWQPGVWGIDCAVTGGLLDAVIDDGPTGVTGVPDEAHELVACLRARGFHRVAQRPTTVLDLRQTRTWSQYLARLPKPRRTAVAHERNAFPADARVTVVPLPELDDGTRDGVADVLAAHDTAKGQQMTAARMTRTLCDLTEVFADRVEAMVCILGGRVAGAVIRLVDEADLAVKMYGADPKLLPREVFPYFNLCFYETIERAGGCGVDTVHYGPTTYAAKLRRGCRLRPLTVWVRTDGTDDTDGNGPATDLHCVDSFRRRALAHVYGLADPASDPD